MQSERTECLKGQGGAILRVGVKSENGEVFDPRLLRAEKLSIESNKMLPVIKEELRLRIISKRHAQGKDEIVVDFNNNNTKYELTETEREKKRRRREQNRRAAQRCRLKKKRMQKGTVENYEMIFEEHVELKAEVKGLTCEIQTLQAILDNHVRSGSCHHLKTELTNETSPYNHPLTHDLDILTKYEAPCVTESQLPSTSFPWTISSDIPEQSFTCTLMQNSIDDDYNDILSTHNLRQQVTSTSSAWSDETDISDIVSDVLVMENESLQAEDPFEGNNQSFYDSFRPSPCDQYQCQKPQVEQLQNNQDDDIPPPSNHSQCIGYLGAQLPDEENYVTKFASDQSDSYLEDNFVYDLEHLNNTLGCDQNYFDESIVEP